MSQQYTPPSPAGATADIPNYLVPAILGTIFCCPPLGIVSIIFAAQVNSKIAAGDTAGATESSRKARQFLLISVGLGLAIWIICIVLWVLLFGLAALSSR